MNYDVIPQNYEQWHHCITVECGIKLTASYIDDRIRSLTDKADFRTQQFIQLYGEDHHHSVLTWFQEAKQNL